MTTHTLQENVQTKPVILACYCFLLLSPAWIMFISPNVPCTFPYSLKVCHVCHQGRFTFVCKPGLILFSGLEALLWKLTGQKQPESLSLEWTIVLGRYLILGAWLAGFSHLLGWGQHIGFHVNSFCIVASFHANWKLFSPTWRMIYMTCVIYVGDLTVSGKFQYTVQTSQKGRTELFLNTIEIDAGFLSW